MFLARVSRGIFRLSLVVILVSLFAAVPVFASADPPQAAPPGEALPVELQEFLQWLITGGGSILAVSWLLERMQWFQRLSPEAKDYTIFGASVVVGCGALAVVMFVPPAILTAISPFFLIISSTFVLVFIAKGFHRVDRINRDGQYPLKEYVE